MQKKILNLEKNVFFMGLASFFTDMASDMVYPLLPIFLTSVLGASFAFVGVIEGIAESTASLLKTFSGYLSDRLNVRKGIIVSGYSLSNIVKPLLAAVISPWQVLFIRFADRFGKGIRTSPRDALIADCSPRGEVGKSFGFHRAMDTLGAAAGPALAFLLLPLLAGDLRKLFLISAIPAAISVIILIFFVYEKKKAAPEPPRQVGVGSGSPPFNFRAVDKRFLLFTLIMTLFTLGNSSDAFLILRAKGLGVPLLLIPILWLMFNLVYSASALPAGIISDKIGRKKVILYGLITYGLVYFGFGFASSPYHIWILFAIYGIYYGLTEGVGRAMVADLIKSEVRATGYGVYHASVGLAVLPASIIMGILWQTGGAAAAFSFGGTLALLAAALLSIFLRP